ncbi:unnamed protein product [Phytophthora lilii]|uniref:Unnamed protein product n=1 Tax=Phytophthora lilii TaxID=2077276 RepID=A0A9W6WUV2_9STRA|nr:unnamed protein product [Phytophthora lilii]
MIPEGKLLYIIPLPIETPRIRVNQSITTVSTMSENAKQKWGQQRAVWSLKQEQVLMELFGKARQDPEKRTGRGVRHHGWESIAEEMNLRCKTAFNVGA